MSAVENRQKPWFTGGKLINKMKSIIKLNLPQKAARIIELLEQNGYEAYAVGGCVRDCALGREPEDWDITTSARPSQVKALFHKTVDTGEKHGTVTVLMGGEGFEVTTYRIDGIYEDGRHPKSVNFTSDLVEDLRRRDFTINAMAYNESSGLVDVFHGLDDLDKKIVRCVGTAEERFWEDSLRILRAVRFCAQLGFAMEENTRRAAKEMAKTLSRISKERIQVETVKLLTSPHPEYIKMAWDLGLMDFILPEFEVMMNTPQNSRYHCFHVGDHTIEVLRNIRSDKVLRLTALLHDCGKPWCRTTDAAGEDHFKGHNVESAKRAERVLKELRLDNETIKRVVDLILWHTYRFDGTKADVRRVASQLGTELFPLLMEVFRADSLAKNPKMQNQLLARIELVERLYEQIFEDGDCLTLKELTVKGEDLIKAGVRPGPEMGEILQRLLEAVLEDPKMNEKERLMGMVEQGC